VKLNPKFFKPETLGGQYKQNPWDSAREKGKKKKKVGRVWLNRQTGEKEGERSEKVKKGWTDVREAGNDRKGNVGTRRLRAREGGSDRTGAEEGQGTGSSPEQGNRRPRTGK